MAVASQKHKKKREKKEKAKFPWHKAQGKFTTIKHKVFKEILELNGIFNCDVVLDLQMILKNKADSIFYKILIIYWDNPYMAISQS